MFCVCLPALPGVCGCAGLWLGKRHVPRTLRMHLDPLCPATARQPQTLCVTLIFSAGAASAWMAAPVGYVGHGL